MKQLPTEGKKFKVVDGLGTRLLAAGSFMRVELAHGFGPKRESKSRNVVVADDVVVVVVVATNQLWKKRGPFPRQVASDHEPCA